MATTKEIANEGRIVAITTVDNPYDPIDQFDAWLSFDITAGHNTCSYLARIAKTSDQFSDEENEKVIEQAIDEILKYDFPNMYVKVVHE